MKSIVRYVVTSSFILSEVASATPYISVTPLQSSTISSDSYEDIRIDGDRDGIIDLWYLKNKDTSIYVSFKNGQVDQLSFKRYSHNSAQVVHFQAANGKLILTKGLKRPLETYNGEPACEDHGAISEVADLTKTLTVKQRREASTAAVSCSNESAKLALSDGLLGLLSSQKYQECFQDKKLASALGAAKVDLALLSEKMKLALKKIGDQTPDSIGLIECKISDDKKIKGTFTENGKISIFIPKHTPEESISKASTSLIFHELVHSTGIKNDSAVDIIVNYCTSGVLPEKNITGIDFQKSAISDASNNAARQQKLNIKRETATAEEKKQSKREIASQASETGGGSDGYNMAKEISSAEVKQAVPSADKLAVNSVNMTDEGKAQAVADSQAQSAPVFAMADRAMGVMNTRALASDDSSSSSVSSSTRSSGDRYQVRHQGYESDSSSTKSSDKTDYSKMIYKPSRSGGTVVEEVDLTKRSAATAGSESTGRTTSANSRGIASTGSAATASTGDGSDEVAGNASSAGGFSSGSNSGGSGTFYADSGSSPTRKTNAGNRRGVASQNTGSAVETSREEVITFISNANYTQAKSKLRDQSFQQTLSNNQISIIYADGSDPIGASRGTTVFLDDGSRFIMQRRK